jgi:hypothetical protein
LIKVDLGAQSCSLCVKIFSMWVGQLGAESAASRPNESADSDSGLNRPTGRLDSDWGRSRPQWVRLQRFLLQSTRHSELHILVCNSLLFWPIFQKSGAKSIKVKYKKFDFYLRIFFPVKFWVRNFPKRCILVNYTSLENLGPKNYWILQFGPS